MKMKRILPITAVLVLGALLLLQPETASQAVRGALTLCFRTVVPSLFPFFVVVSLLLQLGLAGFLQGLCAPLMGPLFRLRGVCALPVLTGLLGGYPSGAKTAADLYAAGELTRQEAELLLGFCDNCGPAFLVGYVGASVLGSPQAGARLFLIHIAAALLTGLLLCRFQPDRGPALLRTNLPAKAVDFPQALTTAASGAVTSTLNICAFVVLFRVLAALAPAGIPGQPWAFWRWSPAPPPSPRTGPASSLPPSSQAGAGSPSTVKPSPPPQPQDCPSAGTGRGRPCRP